LNVVGEVAQLPRGWTGPAAGVPRRRQAKLHVFEESIDSLRTSLLLPDDLRELKIVAVTSAASNEGKTSVASSLAVSVARASHQPTLLLDGDMRSPDVHRRFGIAAQPGLAEVLQGTCSLDEAIVVFGGENVHVLPAGKLTTSPHTLLGNGALTSLLQQLSARYHYIVIDTPPILAGAEALLFAKVADGCLLCALRNSSRAAQVRKASERLLASGSRLIGAVLNGIPWQRYKCKGAYYGAPVSRAWSHVESVEST
jgi:capsular exopolysaccharide synthesis family protein